MRLRHKKWTDKVLNENKDISSFLEDIDNKKISSASSLEIGCGLGGFLLSLIIDDPNKFFLGVEINKNAFASCVKKLAVIKEEYQNFYIVNSPIEKLFDKFSDNQFDNIYINFPDPWPRKREHKRRLTYPTRLKEYYRIINSKGTIYFRSDNPTLFNDSVNYFKETNLFDIKVISPFYVEKENIIPTSEYEQKFRAKDININLLIAKKK